MIKPLTISVFQDEVCCSPHWKRSHSRESSWECSARKVVACHRADTILIIVFPQVWCPGRDGGSRQLPGVRRGQLRHGGDLGGGGGDARQTVILTLNQFLCLTMAVMCYERKFSEDEGSSEKWRLHPLQRQPASSNLSIRSNSSLLVTALPCVRWNYS